MMAAIYRRHHSIISIGLLAVFAVAFVSVSGLPAQAAPAHFGGGFGGGFRVAPHFFFNVGVPVPAPYPYPSYYPYYQPYAPYPGCVYNQWGYPITPGCPGY